MKTTSLLSAALLAAVAALAGCAPKAQYADRAEKIIAEIHNPDSRYVIVAAHRGDWRNYPENSLAAIESAIRMGVDIVEIDLKLTKDSVLVLSHDPSCNRMTTGRGDIRTMTYDSLASFNLKTAHGIGIPGTRITTFREALEACKGRVVINVDQGFQYYNLVVALTDSLGMTGQILIKGRKPREVVEEEMRGGEMMYMPVIDCQNPGGAALFRQYQAWHEATGEAPLAYEVCFSELDSAAVACCRDAVKQGAKLWVNTLWASLCGGLNDDAAYDGNPDEIYGKVLDLGVSMIQTDRPEFLIRWLEKRGRRK